MHRRRFLTTVSAATVAAAVGGHQLLGKGAPQIEGPLHLGGADLAGWVTTLGDLSDSTAGRTPRRTDVARLDHGGYSELTANIEARGVMAQAHASKRLAQVPSNAKRHDAMIEFRLPERVKFGRGNNVGQALEIGLFVCDDTDSRLDRGAAIQWVLNPWVESYGDLRMCTQTGNGIEWQRIANLAPDHEWHRIALCFAPGSRRSRVKIDDQDLDAVKAVAVRHPSNDECQARLQVKTQSCWPGNHESMPPFRAEFRNWRWRSQ